MTAPGGDSGAWTGLEVAIVGMAGCFPGAADVEAFWKNLRDGVEAVRSFTREELLEAGVDPALLEHPDYVRAGGALEGGDLFDAAFFDVTPRDAEILNPQHRVFLERAWEALEHAGYDPGRFGGPIGVFAGSSLNTYLVNVLSNPRVADAVGWARIRIANDKDFLATHTSYRLDLNGPSVSVQTACSTSLVAVHLACQSLLNRECDLALAGGVSIHVPLKQGYLYQPGGINSPDGHCRAFDADANGGVGGEGAGVVVLKRLADALADGDHVHAVIRGSAINNDGSGKVGFTAPSVGGQTRVIAEALAVAAVEPETIQYVETHGTGTPLGDAVEVQALHKVFAGPRSSGDLCALGSAKTAVGHLDAAAGVTGLIKATLAMERGEIPPTLNFRKPNPHIEFASDTFFVNTRTRPWARNGTPRRAGVSSFGIGGTNAHVVLEEAPPAAPSGPSRPSQLLVLSARTGPALRAAAERLADHLERGGHPLPDVAFTLCTGRKQMAHRMALTCRDTAEAVRKLRGGPGARRTLREAGEGERPVAFMIPGLGLHHPNMGRGLYEHEPVYREAVDRCVAVLEPVLGADLREVLFPPGSEEPAAAGGWDLRRLLDREGGGEDTAAARLNQTRFAHPAAFVTAYGLARLWTSWGVRPRALIGHSLGEYVAACLAGVFRLEDALHMVALRARLIDELPEGAMLAVLLPPDEVRPLLHGSLGIGAVNTPESCVVSGPAGAVAELETALAARDVVCSRLPTRHAFHSREMEPVAARLRELLDGVEMGAPRIPFVSNLTGAWITEEEARSPAYWTRHLCEPVRFTDGLATLLAEPRLALLEIGPGQTLGAWALQHPGNTGPDRPVVSSLRHAHNRVPDQDFVQEALGQLWASGVEVDWFAFSRHERRRRVPLPTYPFERERYWIDAPRPARAAPRPAPDDTPIARTEPNEMSSRTVPADEHPREAGPARYEAIVARIKGLVTELTGVEESRIDLDLHFLENGVDSLLLIQAAQRLEKEFGVRLPLVQLLEEISSIAAVARHLDSVLPPETTVPGAEPPAAPAETPPDPAGVVAAPPHFFPSAPAAPAAGHGSELARVIEQQIQLMGQQLRALQGHADVGVPVAGPAAESASAPVAAVEPPARARYEPAAYVAYQPVNSQAMSGMTERQSAYLNDFIARYVERTRASRAHQERYHLPLADSRVTARFRRAWKELCYPIVGERARGSRLWDLDGNEYVDGGMGFGCTLFGHGPDFVTRAIQEELERGYGLTAQSRLAGRAAELICEIGGNERAVFCNSGSESLMAAIRAARTFTGRNRIALFTGSYHGWYDGTQVRLAGENVVPSAPGITPGSVQDVLLLEYDSPASLEALARHMDELAAVVVEPVQSRRPDVQPRAFLHELRRMTRDAGVLLVFDELVTGFRILPGGAQAFFEVDADLVTYGKVVAGGLPMGVVAGKKDVMGVFDGGLWSYGDDSYPAVQRTLFGGAFFKHPISMAATCAIMEEIRRGGVPMYERLNERVARMVARMNAFFDERDAPVTAVHFGSIFRFFFRQDVKFSDLFVHHLIHGGVFVLPETGTCFISTAHTDEDLEVIFRVVCESVERMQQGGLLPGGAEDAAAAAPGAAATPLAVPLTEGQRQLWIEAQMGEEASRAYIESTSLHLHGRLDFPALRRALQTLVDRHEGLRTTFSRDGEHQVIHPAVTLDVPLVDFSAMEPEQREERVRAWVRREAGGAFDLAAGPLVRCAVAALEPEHHLLVISFHHAIADGWSFSVMMNELTVLYAAERERRPADLPPPTRYSDFARERAAAVSGGDTAEADAFWLEQFADGVPVLDLPTDRPRPPVRTNRGERFEQVLDGTLVERLAAPGRKNGLTVFHMLLSTFCVWLGRLSGQDDLVVGVPSAGQAASTGGGRLVGYDINLLPLRVRLDPAIPFLELAREVRRTTLRSVDHQAFSFPRLVERLALRDPSRPPLVSVMFNVDRGGGGESFFLGDLRVEFESNFSGASKLDLNVNMSEGPGSLTLYCDYNTDLFDGATIEHWFASFERLLASVAEAPEEPIWSLDAVPAEDLHRIVDDFCRPELEC
ncbi:MAG TPA: aminotransferase class III-fold pyridoxal phosphate-dependent enzyme [Longimicrobiaceae bacterium]|nr:aminotransferase class III-fold pyridoxal phosphate-dependent enzyme [Longimicrobiaceae bacterium]